jgi:NADPH-dependent curcumin reductase CurA
MIDLDKLSNTQFLLAARPDGMPKDSDWTRTTVPVLPPQKGQVLVQVALVSVDPAMRSWMNDGKSYIEPVRIGDVMRASSAGHVIWSEAEGFQVGDAVTGALGVQQYAVAAATELVAVDTAKAPLASYMNVLGIPGFTAYFGLLEIGKAKSGDVVLVSGAAGAVGSAVGQIAKIKGCRVVGIAGGPAKCRHLTQTLGFDATIDYKAEDAKSQWARACPEGVDVYFDNVGGKILDMALARLRRHARVVICGAISQYNNATRGAGPQNYMSLLTSRAAMEGFVIFDYAPRYPEALDALGGWLASGQMQSYDDVLEGIDSFPLALRRLFEGGNTGKTLLKLTGS